MGTLGLRKYFCDRIRFTSFQRNFCNALVQSTRRKFHTSARSFLVVFQSFGSFLGMGSLTTAIASCLGLLFFLRLVPPALSEEWDSETFVRDLDKLSPKDQDLLERGKEDPFWAEYISEIEPDYDERGFPETTTLDPDDLFYSQFLNWTLTGREEVPYLTIIYQIIDGEKGEDGGALWGVVKGRACGGVLVSTERIITNCLCVASYFASIIWQTEIAKENQASPYDFNLGMRSTGGKYQFDGKLNRIYVQYGSNRYFTNDFMPGLSQPATDRHLVDSKEHKMGGRIPKLTLNQQCAKIVKEAWANGQIPVPGPDGKPPKYYEMAEEPALVPFWPIIKHPTPGQFMPWPPEVFGDTHTADPLEINERKLALTVTGIGFEKAPDSGLCKPWKLLETIFDEGEKRTEEIPLHKHAINLFYLNCHNATRDNEICRGKIGEPKYHRLACLCDLHQPNIIGEKECKILTAGVIGWPVLWEDNVVAITGSPRSLRERGNRMLAVALHEESFRAHVEETITLEKIYLQRTERPPMFREDIVADKSSFFLDYDYPEQPNWFERDGKPYRGPHGR